MTIPLWLFVLILIWAITITIFCFVRNPLPFPDRGHRCFAVPNEQAAKIVTTILDKLAGLPERFSFDPGPTHQTLLWDNTTVIIHHDASTRSHGLPPNGLSVVVRDPRASALEAAEMLRREGFTATVEANIMPEIDNKFALVTSNAFDGWALVFRCHILAMGKPPSKHRLTS